MDKMHYKYEVIANLAKAMEDVMWSYENSCREYDQKAESARDNDQEDKWYQECAEEYRIKYTLSKSLIVKMLEKL